MKNFQFALRNFPFSLNNLLVLFQGEKKSEAMSFNFVVNFWTTVDKNGSITWSVTRDKISILYYFNDEDINLENILSLLNTFART